MTVPPTAWVSATGEHVVLVVANWAAAPEVTLLLGTTMSYVPAVTSPVAFSTMSSRSSRLENSTPFWDEDSAALAAAAPGRPARFVSRTMTACPVLVQVWPVPPPLVLPLVLPPLLLLLVPPLPLEQLVVAGWLAAICEATAKLVPDTVPFTEPPEPEPPRFPVVAPPHATTAAVDIEPTAAKRARPRRKCA